MTDRTDDDVKETTAVPVDTEPNEETNGLTDKVTDEVTDEVSDEQPGEQSADEAVTDGTDEETTEAEPEVKPRRRVNWSRVLALGVLPVLALALAAAAGYLKWQDSSIRADRIAAMEAVQTAQDSTIALLSYQPDQVEQQLSAARDLLTGEFKDSYTSLTRDVVIPGAKEKQISAVATIPAAATVSADNDRVVVLLFVNQTVVVGADPPTDTASSVRVTLDEVDGRWLISAFDPV